MNPEHWMFLIIGSLTTAVAGVACRVYWRVYWLRTRRSTPDSASWSERTAASKHTSTHPIASMTTQGYEFSPNNKLSRPVRRELLVCGTCDHVTILNTTKGDWSVNAG